MEPVLAPLHENGDCTPVGPLYYKNLGLYPLSPTTLGPHYNSQHTRLFSPLRLRRGLCRLVTAVSRDTKGLGSISFIPVMSFDS